MKKTVIAIIAVAVLAFGAVFVIAQRSGHRGHGADGFGRGHGIGMALRGLDLTDEQKAKVKEIIDGNKENVRPVLEAMKANREKLIVMNGAFDEAQVTEIAKDQGDLTSQLIVARERVKSQIFALLTDEQKAKAASMRETFRQRFQERMRKHWKAPDEDKTE